MEGQDHRPADHEHGGGSPGAGEAGPEGRAMEVEEQLRVLHAAGHEVVEAEAEEVEPPELPQKAEEV